MKKIFLFLVILISLASSAQRPFMRFYDRLYGSFKLDTGSRVETPHGGDLTALKPMFKDTITGKMYHGEPTTGGGGANLGDPSDVNGLLKSNGSIIQLAIAGTDYATVSNTHYEIQVKYGTVAPLAANTYNNGTAGVGATLTGNANGAVSFDGVTPSVNDRVLVKDEATQANNGPYIVTTVGDGSNPYVLTRAPDWNQSAEMSEGDAFPITAGNTLAGQTWWQQTTGTITVGTTAIVFTFINSNTVADNSITNAKLADVDANSILGNNTGSPSDPIYLTVSQVETMLGITNVTNDAQLKIASNLSDLNNAGTARTNLGGTTVGQALFMLTNPSAVTFPRINADNSVTARSAVNFKTDLSLENVDNTSDATKNSATATLTNKRITARTGTVASSATPTINTDNVDEYYITALTTAITSMTTNLSGSPNLGDKLIIHIKGTASRTISWGVAYEASTIALPTTTSGTATLSVAFERNDANTLWRVAGVW